MLCLKITDSELAMYRVPWECCNAKQTMCPPQLSATCSVHWRNRSNQIFEVVEHETGKLQPANLLGGNSQSGAIHGNILLSVSWGSVLWGLYMWGMKKVQPSLDYILNNLFPHFLPSTQVILTLCESESFGLSLLCHVIYWEWEPFTLFTAFFVAMAIVGWGPCFLSG